MKMLKNALKSMKNVANKAIDGVQTLALTGAVALTTAVGFAPSDAFAVVDTAAVTTAINDAVEAGHTVGGAIILGIAGLAVIGLVVGIIKMLRT